MSIDTTSANVRVGVAFLLTFRVFPMTRSLLQLDFYVTTLFFLTLSELLESIEEGGRLASVELIEYWLKFGRAGNDFLTTARKIGKRDN